MTEYNCKKFCGRNADFICSTCLLKEIPAERIIEELISRKLIKVQERVENGKRQIQGYYIWKAEIDALSSDKKQK